MTESETRYCTLVPIGGQIIVKRDPPKTRTESGLLLLPTSAKKVQTAVVIRKGPGFLHPGSGKHVTVSDAIHPGTRVVISEYAGTDYEHEEDHGREVYTVMQEAEVLCILGDEDARVCIPDAAVDQDTLDAANQHRASEQAEQQSSMQEAMSKRGEQIARQMMGQSPGGLHLG